MENQANAVIEATRSAAQNQNWAFSIDEEHPAANSTTPPPSLRVVSTTQGNSEPEAPLDPNQPVVTKMGRHEIWTAGVVDGWKHVPTDVLNQLANRDRSNTSDPDGSAAKIGLRVRDYFARVGDGRPWNWTGQCWQTHDKESVEAYATNLLIAIDAYTTPNKTSDLLRALVQCSKPIPEPVDGINMANGLLQLQDGEWKLTPHHPSQGHRYVLPYDYQPDATCPLWLRFLNDVQPDPDVQAHLRRLFGWILLGPNRTRCDRFEIWKGEGSNGKSTALNVIEGLVGESNYSTLSIDQMNGVTVENMMGKLANFGSENNKRNMMDSALFKQIVSYEKILVTPKYRDTYSFRCTAAMVFAVNDLPAVDDQTDGIFRRMKVLPWDVKIPLDRCDNKLDEKLAQELPGILNWALGGAMEVMQLNRFPDINAITQASLQARDDANPVRQFMGECADPYPGNLISKADAYEAYTIWCRKNGHKQAQTFKNFGVNIKRLMSIGDLTTPTKYKNITGQMVKPRDAYPFAIPAGKIERMVQGEWEKMFSDAEVGIVVGETPAGTNKFAAPAIQAAPKAPVTLAEALAICVPPTE